MGSERYSLVEDGIVIEENLFNNVDVPHKFFIDTTIVGKATDREERFERTRRTLELLVESGIDGAADEAPDMSIHIGFNRVGYGIYGMQANILRPTLPDIEVSRLATNAMLQTARNIGYKGVEDCSTVYANVSTKSGITLETNPAGSCGMDTDGMRYNPEDERISLYAHNLYTHEMQLICVSGLIAIAKAR